MDMSVKDQPHYKLAANVLADWLDAQPEKWWSVDGDPLLMSIVDFPCPSDELAAAIRHEGKGLLLQDKNLTPNLHGARSRAINWMGWPTPTIESTGRSSS